MPDAKPAHLLVSTVDVMPFEIACPSCGQKLIADEAMHGQSVNCPACKNSMIVEPPAEPQSADEDDFGLTEELDISATRGHAAQLPIAAAEPASEPEVEVQQEVVEDKEDQPGGTECPGCGVFVPKGQCECPACRFNIQIGRRVESYDGDQHFEGAVGFERFVLKKMHASESLASVYIWSHVAFAFMAAVALLVFRQWWIEIGSVFAVSYGAYHWLAYQHSWFYRGKSFIWVFRLFTGRLWRWKLSKRKVWRVKDPSFTDETLANRTDLKELQIIDLQGTNISDESLSHFQFLDQLTVLVLKNTNVTEGGVVDLQRTIPNTCIWY